MMKEGILKYLRSLNAISQKDFAKKLGVSQQTIASWENGRTEPSNDLLKDIADYFNVSTDYLLGRDISEDVKPLSNEQTKLLNNFESLGADGQNLLKELIELLVMTRSQNVSSIAQQNNGVRNVINVGGNNYVTAI